MSGRQERTPEPAAPPADAAPDALGHIVPLLERLMCAAHEQAAALVKLEERIEAHGELLADVAAGVAVLYRDVEARAFVRTFGETVDGRER